MIKNYIKIAIRNLLKYKGTSFINIFGLSAGITCCILISLFVLDELSYDRYHEKSGQIYRVTLQGIVGTNEFNGAITCAPLAAALARDFPEVVAATRFRSFGFPVLRYGEKVFSEERFFWTDPTIFDVFTIPFIKGDPKTALSKPNTVVITQTMAKKYFGDEDPMGKILDADRKRDYMITGVVEDVPRNSHFHFDFLGSLSTHEDSKSQFWVSNSYYTYFVLQKGVSYKAFEPKLKELVVKYVGPQIEKTAGITLENFIAGGGAYGYFVQPLTDIHLHSNLEHELEPNSDITYVYIFSLIALAILVIACINFMNLATARATRRTKEVGIRKTLGSLRAQLVRQFLAESFIMSFLAVFISLLMVELLLPWFGNFTGKHLAINYLSNYFTVPLLMGLVLVVGFMAGIYPSFFLASFKPAEVLKGTLQKTGKHPWLRSGLVIFQFTVSIVLFIGTFVVYNQLDFIRNRRLGFNKEQLVVIKKTDDITQKIETFKEELSKLPGVIQATNTTTLPGKTFDSNAHQVTGAAGEETHLLWTMRSDYNFAKTFEVVMASGRFFSRDFPTDTSAVVLNQAAVKTLGLTDPIGKVIVQLGSTPDKSTNFQIIGVMKNFHFESLHQKIRPMLIKLIPEKQAGKFVTVRAKPGEIPTTLRQIEHTWRKFALNQAFEYVWFDRDFAGIYEAEERTGQIFAVFSIIAICIACLGLLGLAAFTTEQRTKEIGIRKALGAPITGIVLMLSKEFTRWVLAANIIAWPVAYFITRSWLQSFAYRVDIEIHMFLFSAVLAIIIAFLTVSYQVIKAALANPVESLKYE
jgi:putative ABC transport system permease protein